MRQGQGARLFVVDDDEGMRQALTRLFHGAGFVVETYAAAQEFLDGYVAGPPGCLVLDMHMPHMSGLELQGALAARGIDLPVIFLSGSSNISIAVSAMRVGAVDFLEKPFDNAALLARVRHALARHVPRPPDAAEIAARHAQLSPREREVMGHVVSGQTSKLIARRLGTSHRTVELQRRSMMEKMQAASVAELVRMALTLSRHAGTP